MSDDSGPPTPSSSPRLELALRTEVQDIYRSGQLNNLTVKRVRAAVEGKLALDEGYFKDREEWRERSKRVIQEEAEAQGEGEGERDPKRSTESGGGKRKSDEMEEKQARKRRKSTPEGKGRPVHANGKAGPDSRELAHGKNAAAAVGGKAEGDEAGSPDAEINASESEMSVVLDEDPKAHKKKRQKSTKESKPKKAEVSKRRKSSEGPADPDAGEIKRLQGWLVKCGIRKMWYKELAPYDTPKLKIKHLKEMLADAGMTGRYSKEKADQIREERELKADLEAVTEGNKTWGKSEGEDGEDDPSGRPRRRLARGLQDLDFLNDDDGEETD